MKLNSNAKYISPYKLHQSGSSDSLSACNKILLIGDPRTAIPLLLGDVPRVFGSRFSVVSHFSLLTDLEIPKNKASNPKTKLFFVLAKPRPRQIFVSCFLDFQKRQQAQSLTHKNWLTFFKHIKKMQRTGMKTTLHSSDSSQSIVTSYPSFEAVTPKYPNSNVFSLINSSNKNINKKFIKFYKHWYFDLPWQASSCGRNPEGSLLPIPTERLAQQYLRSKPKKESLATRYSLEGKLKSKHTQRVGMPTVKTNDSYSTTYPLGTTPLQLVASTDRRFGQASQGGGSEITLGTTLLTSFLSIGFASYPLLSRSESSIRESNPLLAYASNPLLRNPFGEGEGEREGVASLGVKARVARKEQELPWVLFPSLKEGFLLNRQFKLNTQNKLRSEWFLLHKFLDLRKYLATFLNQVENLSFANQAKRTSFFTSSFSLTETEKRERDSDFIEEPRETNKKYLLNKISSKGVKTFRSRSLVSFFGTPFWSSSLLIDNRNQKTEDLVFEDTKTKLGSLEYRTKKRRNLKTPLAKLVSTPTEPKNINGNSVLSFCLLSFAALFMRLKVEKPNLDLPLMFTNDSNYATTTVLLRTTPLRLATGHKSVRDYREVNPFPYFSKGITLRKIVVLPKVSKKPISNKSNSQLPFSSLLKSSSESLAKETFSSLLSGNLYTRDTTLFSMKAIKQFELACFSEAKATLSTLVTVPLLEAKPLVLSTKPIFRVLKNTPLGTLQYHLGTLGLLPESLGVSESKEQAKNEIHSKVNSKITWLFKTFNCVSPSSFYLVHNLHQKLTQSNPFTMTSLVPVFTCYSTFYPLLSRSEYSLRESNPLPFGDGVASLGVASLGVASLGVSSETPLRSSKENYPSKIDNPSSHSKSSLARTFSYFLGYKEISTLKSPKIKMVSVLENLVPNSYIKASHLLNNLLKSQSFNSGFCFSYLPPLTRLGYSVKKNNLHCNKLGLFSITFGSNPLVVLPKVSKKLGTGFATSFARVNFGSNANGEYTPAMRTHCLLDKGLSSLTALKDIKKNKISLLTSFASSNRIAKAIPKIVKMEQPLFITIHYISSKPLIVATWPPSFSCGSPFGTAIYPLYQLGPYGHNPSNERNTEKQREGGLQFSSKQKNFSPLAHRRPGKNPLRLELLKGKFNLSSDKTFSFFEDTKKGKWGSFKLDPLGCNTHYSPNSHKTPCSSKINDNLAIKNNNVLKLKTGFGYSGLGLLKESLDDQVLVLSLVPSEYSLGTSESKKLPSILRNATQFFRNLLWDVNIYNIVWVKSLIKKENLWCKSTIFYNTPLKKKEAIVLSMRNIIDSPSFLSATYPLGTVERYNSPSLSRGVEPTLALEGYNLTSPFSVTPNENLKQTNEGMTQLESTLLTKPVKNPYSGESFAKVKLGKLNKTVNTTKFLRTFMLLLNHKKFQDPKKLLVYNLNSVSNLASQSLNKATKNTIQDVYSIRKTQLKEFRALRESLEPPNESKRKRWTSPRPSWLRLKLFQSLLIKPLVNSLPFFSSNDRKKKKVSKGSLLATFAKLVLLLLKQSPLTPLQNLRILEEYRKGEGTVLSLLGNQTKNQEGSKARFSRYDPSSRYLLACAKKAAVRFKREKPKNGYASDRFLYAGLAPLDKHTQKPGFSYYWAAQSQKLFSSTIKNTPKGLSFFLEKKKRESLTSLEYARRVSELPNVIINEKKLLEQWGVSKDIINTRLFWADFFNVFSDRGFFNFLEVSNLPMLRVFWCLNQTNACSMASFNSVLKNPDNWLNQLNFSQLIKRGSLSADLVGTKDVYSNLSNENSTKQKVGDFHYTRVLAPALAWNNQKQLPRFFVKVKNKPELRNLLEAKKSFKPTLIREIKTNHVTNKKGLSAFFVVARHKQSNLLGTFAPFDFKERTGTSFFGIGERSFARVRIQKREYSLANLEQSKHREKDNVFDEIQKFNIVQQKKLAEDQFKIYNTGEEKDFKNRNQVWWDTKVRSKTEGNTTSLFIRGLLNKINTIRNVVPYFHSALASRLEQAIPKVEDFSFFISDPLACSKRGAALTLLAPLEQLPSLAKPPKRPEVSSSDFIKPLIAKEKEPIFNLIKSRLKQQKLNYLGLAVRSYPFQFPLLSLVPSEYSLRESNPFPFPFPEGEGEGVASLGVASLGVASLGVASLGVRELPEIKKFPLEVKSMSNFWWLKNTNFKTLYATEGRHRRPIKTFPFYTYFKGSGRSRYSIFPTNETPSLSAKVEYRLGVAKLPPFAKVKAIIYSHFSTTSKPGARDKTNSWLRSCFSEASTRFPKASSETRRAGEIKHLVSVSPKPKPATYYPATSSAKTSSSFAKARVLASYGWLTNSFVLLFYIATTVFFHFSCLLGLLGLPQIRSAIKFYLIVFYKFSSGASSYMRTINSIYLLGFSYPLHFVKVSLPNIIRIIGTSNQNQKGWGSHTNRKRFSSLLNSRMRTQNPLACSKGATRWNNSRFSTYTSKSFVKSSVGTTLLQRDSVKGVEISSSSSTEGTEGSFSALDSGLEQAIPKNEAIAKQKESKSSFSLLAKLDTPIILINLFEKTSLKKSSFFFISMLPQVSKKKILRSSTISSTEGSFSALASGLEQAIPKNEGIAKASLALWVSMAKRGAKSEKLVLPLQLKWISSLLAPCFSFASTSEAKPLDTQNVFKIRHRYLTRFLSKKRIKRVFPFIYHKTKGVSLSLLPLINFLVIKFFSGTLDFFQPFFEAIYRFFEKPDLVFPNWLAYTFYVEIYSDCISTVPETLDLTIWNWFNKTTGSLKTSGFFGNLLQRRLFCFFYVLINNIYQLDSQLIRHQIKGKIFWDLWSDLLIETTIKNSKISVSDLARKPEERQSLVDSLLFEKDGFELVNVSSSASSASASRKTAGLSSSFARVSSLSRLGLLQQDSFLLKGQIPQLLPLVTIKYLPFLFKNETKQLSHLADTIPGVSLRGKLEYSLGTSESSSSSITNFQKGLLPRKWGANQYVSYQLKTTPLFVDLNIFKCFSHVSAIKYYSEIHYPIGSLVCQIYGGIFATQVAKNILVIGPATASLKTLDAKSILIQALAGETEIKIITDNAARYAGITQGLPVGIKLLKNVFDAIVFQTPCFFLLEDIHLIGEKRLLLISDSHNAKIILNNQIPMAPLENLEDYEKSSISMQFNRQSIMHYKKPYRESSQQAIAANQYCFNFFLANRNQKSNSYPESVASLGVEARDVNFNFSSLLSLPKVSKQGASLPSAIRISASVANTKKTANRSSSLSGNSLASLGEASQSLASLGGAEFSEALLKASNSTKLKPKKILHEISFEDNAKEPEFIFIPKINYSVRKKVALLAQHTLSNFSAKLNIITDLLVIIDNVRSNKGFVVFATTNNPYGLDPALRRPGRLDETIRVPFISNASGRWELLKCHMGTFFRSSVLSLNLKRSLSFDFIEFPNSSGLALAKLYADQASALNFSAILTLRGSTVRNKLGKFPSQNEATLDVQSESKKREVALIPNSSSGVRVANITKPSVSLVGDISLAKVKIIAYCKLAKKLMVNNTLQLTSSISSTEGTEGSFSALDSRLEQAIPKNAAIATKGTPSEATANQSLTSSSLERISYSSYARGNILYWNSVASKKETDVVAHVQHAKNLPFLRNQLYSHSFNLKVSNFRELANSKAITDLEENDNTWEMSKYTTKGSLAMMKRKLMHLFASKVAESFVSELFYTSPLPLPLPFGEGEGEGYAPLTTGVDLSSFLISKEKQRKAYVLPSHAQLSKGRVTNALSMNNIVSQDWKEASFFVKTFLQKRYMYNKNIIVNSLICVANSTIFGEFKDEPSNPPHSTILVPAKRYENYKKVFAINEKKVFIKFSERVQLHATSFASERQEAIKNPGLKLQLDKGNKKALGYTSLARRELKAALQAYNLNAPKHSKFTPSGANFYYNASIVKRHKHYLTNQWSNGQLDEHNAETIFLSDVDWRSMSTEEFGDLYIDFPDADQIFNPRRRRWVLNTSSSGGGTASCWPNLHTYDQEISDHFVMQAFNTVYIILDKNREQLDLLSYKLMKTGFLKELHFVKLVS